jgi:FMN phosphatase YigB (HAD superfamily)
MTNLYVFDAYGTLFDVHSAVARHAAYKRRQQLRCVIAPAQKIRPWPYEEALPPKLLK